jgi:hypothetical protein
LKKVTGDAAEKYKADTVELLKEAFKAIFATPKHVINEQLKKLLHRFQSLGIFYYFVTIFVTFFFRCK